MVAHAQGIAVRVDRPTSIFPLNPQAMLGGGRIHAQPVNGDIVFGVELDYARASPYIAGHHHQGRLIRNQGQLQGGELAPDRVVQDFGHTPKQIG